MSAEPTPLRLPAILGEAMRPLAATLKQALDQPVTPTVEAIDMLGFVSRHITTLAGLPKPLIDDIRSALAASSDADVHHAVGRLEVRLEHLMASYEEVRRADAEVEDIEGWSLLNGIYRDVLLQIKGWLDEIADTLTLPISELERRGLLTQGNVNIRVDLRAPNEMEDLTHWLDSRCAELDEARLSRPGSHLAALLAGAGMVWLFGGGDGE